MRTPNHRLPNYKISPLISGFQDFTNYNLSIRASYDANGNYQIYHWKTLILTYNKDTNQIVFLETRSISMTTSSLVGKIVRAIPTTSLLAYLNNPENQLSRYNKRRIAKMTWGKLDYTLF